MNTIAGLCGYIVVIAFAVYTLFCFTVFKRKDKERQNRVFVRQRVCIFVMHFVCHALLYMIDYNVEVIFMYAVQVVLFLLCIHIYQIIYKGLSKLVLNNMIMLIMISFVMMERIKTEYAFRQMFMFAAGMAACLLVPYIIKKFKYFDILGWYYAAAGIAFLALLLVFGVEKHGAKNWLSVGGVLIQPLEFVKILYVFFMAAVLSKAVNFKRVVIISAAAAVHVLILVLEKDLGGALIYFFTYLIVLVIATGNIWYLLAGMAGGASASVVAYQLFAHVRNRVAAWKDPWSVIDNAGYQVAQSLFAIAAGGWFGLGLGRGLPGIIPVVESDFIFSAMAEELGGIFVICILLVYISCFIMVVNISMKMTNTFYKLTAAGLGVMFIFQVFVAVGGVTKFIPSTGVTLPLISYGGSSVISTVLMFSIIQGMYVLNKSEVDKNENLREAVLRESGISGQKSKRKEKY